MTRSISSSSIGLLLAVPLLSCGGGGLNERYHAVHNAFTGIGLANVSPVASGSLSEGNEVRFIAPMTSGQCQTFVALAEGAEDISIRVLSPSGADVAHDTTRAGQATVAYCATEAGEHVAVVRMEHGSGGYGFSVFSATPSMGATRAPTTGTPTGTARTGSGTCADPYSIALNEPQRGDTRNAGVASQATCGQTQDAPERIFRLHIAERTTVEASLQSEFDGVLYIQRACADQRSEVVCNDDAGNTSQSRVTAALDPGDYFIVVDGYGGQSGAFELVVRTQGGATGPTGVVSLAQACTNVDVLQPGQAVRGSTRGQSDSFQSTCADGARSPDHVYRLTITQRSRVQIVLQSDHDGALHVRRDCLDPATELGCNDDAPGSSGSQGRSELLLPLDPGEYFIIADGYSSATQGGNYTLTANVAPLAVNAGGAGDNCSSATVLQIDATNPTAAAVADTLSATDDFSGSCGGQGAPDVVYSFNVAQRSRVRARFPNAPFEAVAYLQRGCGAGSTELMCARVQGTDGVVEAVVNPGSYNLIVDGANANAFGVANVEVTVEDLNAAARVCQQAPVLRPGRPVQGTTAGAQDRFQGSCAGNTRSGDSIYRLQLHRRTHMRISLDATYDGALHIRRDCSDVSTEVACDDDGGGSSQRSLVDTTLDAGTYFVIVDGYGTTNSGTFTLEATEVRGGSPPGPSSGRP